MQELTYCSSPTPDGHITSKRTLLVRLTSLKESAYRLRTLSLYTLAAHARSQILEVNRRAPTATMVELYLISARMEPTCMINLLTRGHSSGPVC